MDEKILDRIRKLLALATSSNEHEAALAAARAQDLLFQHNLTAAQVVGAAAAKEARENSYQQHRWESGRETWRTSLVNALASNNFCQAVYIGKGQVSVIGKPENAEFVRFMFNYLTVEIDRLSGLARRKRDLAVMFGDDEPIQRPLVWLNNFRVGAVQIIGERLREQANRNRRQSSEAEALVVVSGKELAKRVKQFFPRLQNVKRKFQVDTDGFEAGQQAGRSIGLERHGLSSGNPLGRRLLT